MFSARSVGFLLSCVLTALLGLAWAQPARAIGGNEIWTMQGVNEGQAFTIAKIDLSKSPPVTTVYGVGIHDPTVGDSSGRDWTTIAVSESRQLYLLRRLPQQNGVDVNVHIYSIGADSINLHTNTGSSDPIPNNVIDNLKDVGMLPLKENIDGLCVGPDGNIYFTAASSFTSLPGVTVPNGLYRFRPATGNTEFVGSFKNMHFVGNPLAGTIDAANSRTVFYTDAAFDPITKNLVGDGIDPNGRFTLYQLDGNTVLTAGSDAAHPSVEFDWHYFGGDSSAWATRDLSTIGWPNPDGVAFDAASGNLYLSGDGQGVGFFDRDLATNLGYLDDSVSLHLGYDLASIAAGPPEGVQSISGIVYCDTNRNGAPDPGEGASATVTLRDSSNNVVGSPIITTAATGPTDVNGGKYLFSNLLPGTYTVTVSPTVLPDGCTLISTNPLTVTLTVGGGDSTGNNFRYIPSGGGATRTWGFYKTHLAFFTAVVASGAINLGDLTVTPAQSSTVTHEDLTNTIGKLAVLEAIFYTAPGQATTPLGQARLQLAHQLIAAEANAYYIGTVSPTIVALINAARTALDGTDIAAMTTLTGQLDTFNNSGDTISLPSPLTEGKADPKGAAAVAAAGPGTGPAFF